VNQLCCTRLLQETFKKDLYQQYETFFKPTPEKVLCKKSFLHLWSRIFPALELYDQCNICGKCPICALIDAMRKSNGGSEEMKRALLECYLLHR